VSRRTPASRAADLAIRAAELLGEDLQRRRDEYDAAVKKWNTWLEVEGHDGSEDDAPDEPSDHPPLPDRHMLYSIQVAAAAARPQFQPGRPRSKPPQPRKRKP
jgi:hypothetical protein